jgi:hypothetical protein
MSLARLLLIGGAASLGLGIASDGRLPTTAEVLPALHAEPRQQTVAAPRFGAHAGNVDYRIAPLAEYDIAGLVVSRHDADTWWDWIHRASNDHLNVVDLCMVWGVNAAEGAYEKMSSSSGQFRLLCQQPRYVRALSNNHLLTDDPHIARQLRRLQVGDQVRIRGQLASYSHEVGFAFSRGTSLTREDTGNGACETIFVRDVAPLRRAPAWPQWLRWLGIGLLAFGLVAWWRAPHRPRP